jgi:hypothetical protein
MSNEAMVNICVGDMVTPRQPVKGDDYDNRNTFIRPGRCGRVTQIEGGKCHFYIESVCRHLRGNYITEVSNVEVVGDPQERTGLVL